MAAFGAAVFALWNLWGGWGEVLWGGLGEKSTMIVLVGGIALIVGAIVSLVVVSLTAAAPLLLLARALRTKECGTSASSAVTSPGAEERKKMSKVASDGDLEPQTLERLFGLEFANRAYGRLFVAEHGGDPGSIPVAK